MVRPYSQNVIKIRTDKKYSINFHAHTLISSTKELEFFSTIMVLQHSFFLYYIFNIVLFQNLDSRTWFLFKFTFTNIGISILSLILSVLSVILTDYPCALTHKNSFLKYVRYCSLLTFLTSLTVISIFFSSI